MKLSAFNFFFASLIMQICLDFWTLLQTVARGQHLIAFYTSRKRTLYVYYFLSYLKLPVKSEMQTINNIDNIDF